MHTVTFLQDLAVVMIVAALVSIIFRIIRQPVVLGYILAGMIIGPHTPPIPLIKDQQTINTLADLGVLFLMFSLGLEFSLRRLKKVGLTALTAASIVITVMLTAGYQIGRSFHWRSMDSLFLGAMISVSSTTIIVKVLGDLGKRRAKFADIIFGILIVEDILAIVMIALLSGIAITGSLQPVRVLSTLTYLGTFLATTLIVGLIVVPRLLSYLARFHSNEITIVAVLGLCFGISLLAVKLNYSLALGAFVMGAIIAESREIEKIHSLIEPIRDMFSAIFFVAVGLLIDPALLIQYAWPITIITLVVVVGQVVSCSLGAFLAGSDTKTSLRVGMSMAQIGEFSFIIASLGLTLKVTSEFLYPIAVMVSSVTTLISPYLIRNADRFVDWFDRTAPKSLVNYLDFYTTWVGQLNKTKKNDLASRLIRKWFWQMGLNSFLTAAIFLSAAFIVKRTPAWFPQLTADPVTFRTILWLAAAILSLPFFIATFRKLQALGLLVADLTVQASRTGERAVLVRKVISDAIPLAGMLPLTVMILALSSTLLPPLRVFIVLLTVIGLLVVVLWKPFVKIYSQGQVALIETLDRQPAADKASQPSIESLLKEAQLSAILIDEASPAANKLILDLSLRNRTGASIVGIDRDGNTIINPAPQEMIKPGDQIMLLGSPEQLASAVKVFRAEG